MSIRNNDDRRRRALEVTIHGTDAANVISISTRRLTYRLGGNFGPLGGRSGPANSAKAVTVDYR